MSRSVKSSFQSFRYPVEKESKSISRQAQSADVIKGVPSQLLRCLLVLPAWASRTRQTKDARVLLLFPPLQLIEPLLVPSLNHQRQITLVISSLPSIGPVCCPAPSTPSVLHQVSTRLQNFIFRGMSSDINSFLILLELQGLIKLGRAEIGYQG